MAGKSLIIDHARRLSLSQEGRRNQQVGGEIIGLAFLLRPDLGIGHFHVIGAIGERIAYTARQTVPMEDEMADLVGDGEPLPNQGMALIHHNLPFTINSAPEQTRNVVG